MDFGAIRLVVVAACQRSAAGAARNAFDLLRTA
jgi:hypothetical protein